MKRIAIMPHAEKPGAPETTRRLSDTFAQREIEVMVDLESAEAMGMADLGRPVEYLRECDAVIALGGDGALLRAVRLVGVAGVPVMGVNFGRLGFLTELEFFELEGSVNALLDGKYGIEERMMLTGVVTRDGVPIQTYTALNDIVITRGTFARIIRLDTVVAGQNVANFHADGIIISSPTGSTAYSLSAGGPIVNPGLETLIITPICPHTLATRSVLTLPNETVRVIVNARDDDVMLTVDGYHGFKLHSGDEVTVRKADQHAKFIKLSGRGFYEVLNTRLSHPQV